MSVFFYSDLHLGHRNILKHTAKADGFRGGTDTDSHDEWVIERMLSVNPTKRTVWYLLGDVAMDESKLDMLHEVPGRKWLVMGNHDLFEPVVYHRVFEKIFGPHTRYGLWISHMPIHPDEFYRRPGNVHGHTHFNPLADDPRYLNMCVEWVKRPWSVEEVKEYFA